MGAGVVTAWILLIAAYSFGSGYMWRAFSDAGAVYRCVFATLWPVFLLGSL
jgi:hypothetical protein